MTVFNNPHSPVPVATLLNASFNQVNGVNILTGSRILVDNDAALQVISNQASGHASKSSTCSAFTQALSNA